MQKRLFPRIAAAASALLLLAACGQSRPEGPAEVLLHTTAGDIRIELDGRTPLHRDNFLKLTREGFFDSVLFHRVIADFMIQAGDPASRRAPAGTMLGESDAGYLIPAEIVYPALAHTRGALAAFERPPLPCVEDLLASAHRVAVLEDVTNYTNIGAVFRSAAALGIDAVLVTPSCHDPLYRRAARVSMGTVFQVPWTRIGSVRDWATEGVPLLRSLGFATAALALADDAIYLHDARLRDCERLALVLGTEGDGLAASTIAASDYTVKIPMDHDVDSLNVAAASAVAFWELRTKWR